MITVGVVVREAVSMSDGGEGRGGGEREAGAKISI
jgi:hypothetical protein